jgi:UDP-galactopyranose mutase
MNISKYKVIIVGAGFYGTTCANLISKKTNLPILLIDSRNHVGGNSYSEINQETGIEYHKYGSHLFHTSSEKIWKYVKSFSDFNDYRHYVYTIHKNEVYSMPINLITISQYFKKYLTPSLAKELITNKTKDFKNIDVISLEDLALTTIGLELYEAFIKNYTLKQWQTDPKFLPASTLSRLPVRFDANQRYFSDKYEGIPVDGYTQLFNRMLDSNLIDVELNCDFFQIKDSVKNNQLVIYTGPIDRYFENQYGNLKWRTLDFESEIVNTDDYQGTSVMNYADLDVNFTRIHEFKHLHPEREKISDKSFIMKEYSRFAGKSDEPYYPVNGVSDREILKSYKDKTRLEFNVHFGGRLGTYKYLDMHMAIGSAMSFIENKFYDYIQKLKLL